jgi:RIO-like serine/threonine protein kinase
MTDDPEVLALQAVIKGLHHIGAKSLQPRHLKVLSAVEVCKKGLKVEPTITQIAAYAGLDPTEIESEIEMLVERRYLIQIVNTFGELKLTYKMGPMGGTALRTMLDRRRPRKELADAR